MNDVLREQSNLHTQLLQFAAILSLTLAADLQQKLFNLTPSRH